MTSFWDQVETQSLSKTTDSTLSEPVNKSFWDEAQQLPEMETKSKFPDIGRHVARTGSRIIESALGIPGEILSIPRRVSEFATEKYQGSPLTKEQLKKSKEIEKWVVPGIHHFPTSEKIRENIEKYTGDYLKPQNEEEALSDDIFSMATALFNPSKGSGFLKPLTRALGISGLSHAAGKGVESFAGEEAGEYAKFGTALLSSLYHPKGIPAAKEYVGNLYKEVESSIPSGTRVRAIELDKRLQNLKNNVSKGTLAKSEKFIADEVDAISRKIQDGSIGVDELIAAKRSLNEKMQDFIFTTPEKAAKGRARKLSTEIQKSLDKELDLYGKMNPKFGEKYNQAQNAFAALQQSQKVRNFISKNIDNKAVKGGIGAALVHGVANPSVLVPTAASAAAGLGAIKLGEITMQIAKSPTLRKHYLNVLESAAKENAVSMNKNIMNLEKEYQKEYSEEND